MTYLVPARSRIVQRMAKAPSLGIIQRMGRSTSMGDLFDFINDKVTSLAKEEVGCLDQANKSQAVAGLDAKIDDLARNWNPTGFYTASDLQTVYRATMDAITSARAALTGAIFSTSDADQVLKQASAYLDRATTRGNLYPAAIASASSTGAPINAPGLKQWVIDSLVNVGQAYTTVAVLQCRATWLDTAAVVVSAVWSVVKRVVGVVIKAGETVLNVADDVLDLYKVVKWGAVAAGAAFVLWHVRKAVQP